MLRRVQTLWTGIAGAPFLTTTYFNYASAADPDQVNETLEDFWTSVASGQSISMSRTVLSEHAIIDPVSGEITQFQEAASVGGAGGSPAKIIPTACQINVALRTAAVVDGRRVAGRLYLPGQTVSNGESAPSLAAQAQANVALAQLIGDSTSTGVLSVWHRPITDEFGVVTRNGSQHAVVGGLARGQYALLRSRRD